MNTQLRPTDPRALRTGHFAETLAFYLERDGRSLNTIAHEAYLDVGYLHRLKTGHKLKSGNNHSPSRDVIIRIGLALRLTIDELNELLDSADYALITRRDS